MNILFNFLVIQVMDVVVLVFVIYIWAQAEDTNRTLKELAEKKPLTSTTDKQDDKSTSYPLTGTKPESNPMCPLRKLAPVNEHKPVNVTKNPTDNKGGK